MYIKQQKIGLVVSTYGSPSYVHLHLATSKKLHPNMPVLIHDDGSPTNTALQINKLCKEYGADFSTGCVRLGHQGGDIYAFYAGLLWAERNGIDLLVKMSRRFIPKKAWAGNLLLTATYPEEDVSTFGNYCSTCNFLLRTECMAMQVKDWMSVIELIHEKAVDPKDDLVAELFMYDLVKTKLRKSKKIYEEWSLLGESRWDNSENAMWHITSSPTDYFEHAKSLGLDYCSHKEFEIIGIPHK